MMDSRKGTGCFSCADRPGPIDVVTARDQVLPNRRQFSILDVVLAGIPGTSRR